MQRALALPPLPPPPPLPLIMSHLGRVREHGRREEIMIANPDELSTSRRAGVSAGATRAPSAKR